MSMNIDCECTPAQVAAIFAGPQVQLVAQSSDRLPKDWQQDGDYIRSTNAWHNDPGFKKALEDTGKYLVGFDCVRHFIEKGELLYTPDIDAHLKAVLTQAQAEYPGALNLSPLVELAIRMYNHDVIEKNQKSLDTVYFQYD